MATPEMGVLGSLAGNQFGGDTDIGGSILGLNMPSDLNRAGAIIAGQEDPAIKQQGQNIQSMALIAGLKQKQEEMELKRIEALPKLFETASFLGSLPGGDDPKARENFAVSISKAAKQLKFDISPKDAMRFLDDESSGVTTGFEFAADVLGKQKYRELWRAGKIDTLSKVHSDRGTQIAEQAMFDIAEQTKDPKTGEPTLNTETVVKILNRAKPGLSRYVRDETWGVAGYDSPKTMTETRKAQRPTPTDLDIAKLVTGKNVKTLDELSPEEKEDVLYYKGTTDLTKEQILRLRKERQKEGVAPRVSDILGEAMKEADKRRVTTQVSIMGQGAEQREAGKERGIQSVISERLDRLKKEQETIMGSKPLESTDRQAIQAMEQTLKAAGSIKSEFTPEEINRYVGFFNKSAREIAQLVNQDKKFARLNTLINFIKGSAFSEGGKQLTPFEASITFGHVPTGTEFSTVDFLSKLDTTIEMTETNIRGRYEKAVTPRRNITPKAAASSIDQEIEAFKKKNPNLFKK